MILQMNKFGSVLGSRRLGSVVRNEIEKALNSGENVVFDLTGINTVSNSFADECFGKLLIDREFASIRKQTSFINTGSLFQGIIKSAINDRLAKIATA